MKKSFVPGATNIYINMDNGDIFEGKENMVIGYPCGTMDKEIAALFDADLFGWQVKAVNWCYTSEETPWMDLEITLFRYQ